MGIIVFNKDKPNVKDKGKEMNNRKIKSEIKVKENRLYKQKFRRQWVHIFYESHPCISPWVIHHLPRATFLTPATHNPPFQYPLVSEHLLSLTSFLIPSGFPAITQNKFLFHSVPLADNCSITYLTHWPFTLLHRSPLHAAPVQPPRVWTPCVVFCQYSDYTSRHNIGHTFYSPCFLLPPRFTITFRAFSRLFYPKRLTNHAFVRRKRNNNISLLV